MQELDIQSVDKVLDEINEQADQMAQIQDAMSQPMGGAAALDDDELLAELEVNPAPSLGHSDCIFSEHDVDLMVYPCFGVPQNLKRYLDNYLLILNLSVPLHIVQGAASLDWQPEVTLTNCCNLSPLKYYTTDPY